MITRKVVKDTVKRFWHIFLLVFVLSILTGMLIPVDLSNTILTLIP